MSDEMENEGYEVDSLADAIKRVEMAKKKKPELYAKAVAKLKEAADVISSIDDLRKKRDKLKAEESESDE